MSIQDLGSIGELISAVAVLATLIYLSIQTKQTRKAAEQTAYFSQLQANVSTVDLYSRWRTYLQDPGLLEIIGKANRGGNIHHEEQIRLSAAFQELFAAAAAAHINSRTSGSVYDSKADIEYLASVFDTIPCAVSEWNRFQPMVNSVSTELADAIDEYLEQGQSDET